MKLFLYYIGKPRDLHANAMAEDYMQRAGRFAKCEMREVQPNRFELWAKHSSAVKILLDPGGKQLDSYAFSDRIARAMTDARDLVFVLGGHDGLPGGWREKADELLSLSSMTLPHELARVVLAEQIYRAFTIQRGHPYPR